MGLIGVGKLGQEVDDHIMETFLSALDHRHNRPNVHIQPGFLFDFPPHSFNQTFARFQLAAGDMPKARCRRFAALDQQDSLVLVKDNGAYTN